jgi:GT2 family glycosyltransferase
MKISVVIPIYNAEKTILRCLESISLQTFREFELILVDNNSTDSSVSIIKDFITRNIDLHISLLHEPKQGSCSARNRGGRFAKGKIIVNTDPDCIADKDWLRDIASEFDDDSIGGVAGNIYGFSPKSLTEKFLSIFTLKGLGEEKTFDSYNLLTGGFATANLSIRKDVFEKIGGFDEDINIFGEDHDICARIYKSGSKIKTVPNAVIYHIHRAGLKGFLRQSFNFGIAHSVLLKKHFPEGLFLELPRFTFTKESFGIPVWLSLNSFDKKIYFICLAGYFIPLILTVLPIYIAYQMIDIKKRAERFGMKISAFESLFMSGLLFIKSFSMTMGRIYGSIKNRVICI